MTALIELGLLRTDNWQLWCPVNVLVCNIGSTSFKFRLFATGGGAERELACGGADRIGGAGGVLKWRIGPGPERSQSQDFADHGRAIQFVLKTLVDGEALGGANDLDAVAFKAVMAGDCEPVALVDDALLERIEFFVPVAPAHNPPYLAAMRMFRRVLPSVPLVAAFEPGFHRTIPARRRYYAVNPEWADRFGVKRYGFHGASHRYIATRTAELMGPAARRVISCHLGGSSSICAVRDGASVATSMGLSPQSGLPQSTRAGDFDPFALALLAKQAGLDTEAVLAALGNAGGLAALSGASGDMRDIRKAARALSPSPMSGAPAGNSYVGTAAPGCPPAAQAAGMSGLRPDAQPRAAVPTRLDAEGAPLSALSPAGRAKLTLELFATCVRDFIGAYLVELGGADALVFTGGIGENDAELRAEVCAGMEFAGVKLDAAKNNAARGECRVEASDSRTAIWVMPTNEELIVARQAAEFLMKFSERV